MSTKIVSVYDFDIEKARREVKIIELNSPDERWLDFITINRRGKEVLWINMSSPLPFKTTTLCRGFFTLY